MSVKVQMDNWITAHSGSEFTLELQTVPRVGEKMRIHRDLFADTYKSGGYDYLEFDCDDNCAEVEVSVVEHLVTPAGHEIRVCFDIDGDFTKE